MSNVLIKNIGRLQTPVGSYPHKGKKQGENRKLDHAAIFIENGRIAEITSGGRLPQGAERADLIVDAAQNLVTPGLVDGHTHIVFGGYRQQEIPLKPSGKGYLDILRAGGGIPDTVKKTRKADFAELYNKTKKFLDEMMHLGVTTCEAKS